LASEYFKENDYIRNYQEFLRIVNKWHYIGLNRYINL